MFEYFLYVRGRRLKKHGIPRQVDRRRCTKKNKILPFRDGEVKTSLGTFFPDDSFSDDGSVSVCVNLPDFISTHTAYFLLNRKFLRKYKSSFLNHLFYIKVNGKLTWKRFMRKGGERIRMNYRDTVQIIKRGSREWASVRRQPVSCAS